MNLLSRIERFLEDSRKGNFEDLAQEAFAYQYERIPALRRLADGRGRSPEAITRWQEIPAVPVAAFKSLELCTDPPREIFRSSGTTGGKRSVHRHPFPDLYRRVISLTFPTYCLPPGDALGPRPPILALVPPRSLLPDSSLGFMVDHVLTHHGDPEGSAYAFGDAGVEIDAATRWCRERHRDGRPVLVLATSFALAQWLEEAPAGSTPLPPGSAIFDTGGFKGRYRELSPGELLNLIHERLGVPPNRVVREYGMTELTSQLYTRTLTGGDPNLFVGPHWLHPHLLDPVTLESVAPGETGMIALFDLANLGSAVHLLTQDLGRAEDEGLRLLGRASEAELRGCSLTVEELQQHA